MAANGCGVYDALRILKNKLSNDMKTPEQIIIEQKWPDDVPFETMYYKTTEIIIKCMKQYAAQFEQGSINNNVVRPTLDSSSGGGCPKCKSHFGINIDDHYTKCYNCGFLFVG